MTWCKENARIHPSNSNTTSVHSITAYPVPCPVRWLLNHLEHGHPQPTAVNLTALDPDYASKVEATKLLHKRPVRF